MRERYLPWSRENKKPKTYKREAELFRLWIEPVIGEKALNDISPFDIEKVKSQMKKAERSPRTIEYCLTVLKATLNRAKEWGFLKGENPASSVKPPRKDNRRLRFLTPEEAQALLAEVRKRSEQTWEMCLLALHCGLRFGEIANLTWGDIDLAQGQIYIRDPKNNTTRVAYMTDEVRKMFAAKKPGLPEELVFKDRKGKRIEKVSNSFIRAVEALKLNEGVEDPRMRVCFHTLRHTFGSWLVMAGVPIYTVKELMGHKSLAMTERYAHLAAEAQREASREIEKVACKIASENVIFLNRETRR